MPVNRRGENGAGIFQCLGGVFGQLPHALDQHRFGVEMQNRLELGRKRPGLFS